MSVHPHLIEHRWLGSVASLIAALIHLGSERFRFSIRLYRPFNRGCVLIVLICLSLVWPLVALSQEIDEGEFSRTMLG
jgi:hypothetical protein